MMRRPITVHKLCKERKRDNKETKNKGTRRLNFMFFCASGLLT